MAAKLLLCTMLVIFACATAVVDGTAPRSHLENRFLRSVPAALRARLAKRTRSSSSLGRRSRAVAAADSSSADGSGFRVTPTQFGGDPTGVKDSTAAVLAAVAACVNRSNHTSGVFPVGARDAGEHSESLHAETVDISIRHHSRPHTCITNHVCSECIVETRDPWHCSPTTSQRPSHQRTAAL
jgi:hypothetical protein